MSISNRQLKATLFWGKKGSGKSYVQGVLLSELFKEYYKTEEKYPYLPHRVLYSNQKFSDQIRKKILYQNR